MFSTQNDSSLNTKETLEQKDANQEQREPLIPEGQVKQPDSIDYKELFLRLTADFQNHQKRVEKQKNEWIVIGQESIILKFLPIIQDLERALNAAILNNQEKAQPWVQGLSVINKNLLKTLNDLDVKEIEATGLFNPEIHEAIAQIDSPNHSAGQIVDVVNKGYLFKGKVIKFAQVTVAK